MLSRVYIMDSRVVMSFIIIRNDIAKEGFGKRNYYIFSSITISIAVSNICINLYTLLKLQNYESNEYFLFETNEYHHRIHKMILSRAWVTIVISVCRTFFK